MIGTNATAMMKVPIGSLEPAVFRPTSIRLSDSTAHEFALDPAQARALDRFDRFEA
jgi:hypothetical protein